MKKNKVLNLLNGCDLETLIETHNPFGIKSKDGNIKWFANYAEVYFYVLTVLHTSFSRGYLDLILIIAELTNLSLTACEEVFKDMQPLWGKMPEHVVEYKWESDDLKDYHTIILLLKCLHLITETKFSEEQFFKALEMFKLKLAKEGYSKL